MGAFAPLWPHWVRRLVPNDLMIAAIALVNQLILVTHNTREFARVAGLQLEDWA